MMLITSVIPRIKMSMKRIIATVNKKVVKSMKLMTTTMKSIRTT